MDYFVVEGPTPLRGTVRAAGAKNAALPLMAAAMLAEGRSVLANLPDLRDTRFFLDLLGEMGVRGELDGGTLTLDTTGGLTSTTAPYEIVRKMRASIYVLGPLLAVRGEARVSRPGGCAFGPRPVDLHERGMAALGAELAEEHGYIVARAPRGGLRGGRFRFDPVSVGATCNVLMAAVLARGESRLENCAIEPEVTQLVEALVAAGAHIEGAGTRTLEVQGVASLTPLEVAVIPDRIEAGTYLAAAAIAGGEVRVEGCRAGHMAPILAVLRDLGCKVTEHADDDDKAAAAEEAITCARTGPLAPVRVETQPFPGFPTDMQAQIMAAAALADGVSFVTDTIYPDRFTHAAELVRLGARIEVKNGTATIIGTERLQAAPVMASDLRASAALVLAAAAAHGCTEIRRVYHIDRGYERIEHRLTSLGARITRASE
ncbi:UDP-N-acetylglucosamine 1-carboxyvinyltransferase [bacterium]|nr:UDP-N-acetylglucosamine 1-carboxyvinyltransferase [bacterium]